MRLRGSLGDRVMKVMTFDPGGHTGWSFWSDGELVDCGCEMDLTSVIKVMSHYLSSGEIVVCEDFIGKSNTNDEKLAIRRIGTIETMAAIMHCKLVMQVPAVRKGYLQFAKGFQLLQNIDPSTRRHAKDAIAHGIRYHCKEVNGWQKQYLTY